MHRHRQRSDIISLKVQMIKNYFLKRFYALQIPLRIVTYFILDNLTCFAFRILNIAVTPEATGQNYMRCFRVLVVLNLFLFNLPL
jgi:hypothetical protein